MPKKIPNKYWEAIMWIALNDDTDFMDEETPCLQPSVTLSMVASLWNVPVAQAVQHLRKALEERSGNVPEDWHKTA